MTQKKPQVPTLAKHRGSLSSRQKKVLDAPQLLAEQEKVQPSKRRRRLTYAGLVKSLAKEYGVSVGEAPAAKANPYSLNAAETEKVLRKAGVHTRTGKLASLFK